MPKLQSDGKVILAMTCKGFALRTAEIAAVNAIHKFGSDLFVFQVNALQFHFLFIPFDFPWKFYPAFNLADSSIVLGVLALVLTWGRETGTDVARTA